MQTIVPLISVREVIIEDFTVRLVNWFEESFDFRICFAILYETGGLSIREDGSVFGSVLCV